MKRIRNLLPVLLVLIAVFSLVLWFGQHVKGTAVARAGQVYSVQQMRDLSAAAMAYATTHGNSFPATLPVLLAASPGLPSNAAVSPLASDKTIPSYEMVAPAQPLMQISDPAHTPMMRSLFTTQGGKRIVAFCDGHIELVSE